MIPRSFLACCAACCALPAAALLVRPDRDDAEYLELASRYTSSVPLNAPAGEGVLIAPRWILTTAHLAAPLKARTPLPRLRIAGSDRQVDAVHVHPAWRGGRDADLALVRLAEPVLEATPTPIHVRPDEQGKAVVFVAHGPSGPIGAPPSAPPRARGAINTVDRVEERLLGLRVKPLDEASDLQGALLPQEAGAPAYLQADDGLFVAGIAVEAGGEWQLFARVSAYAAWIRAVMLDAAAEEAEKLLGAPGG